MRTGPFDVIASLVRRDALVEGEGLLSLDVSGLELLIRRDGCDPSRAGIAVDEVREIRREGQAALELELARGERLRVVFWEAEDARALEAELVARCCTLPELTRALRSLGRRRSATRFAAEADRFFEPLLAARRIAAEGTSDAALAAFHGATIASALERTAAEFASSRHPDRASARRALEARLCDRLEPLMAALAALDERAGALKDATDGRLSAWRSWVTHLRSVFERADECWPHLAEELERAPAAPARVPRRRSGR